MIMKRRLFTLLLLTPLIITLVSARASVAIITPMFGIIYWLEKSACEGNAKYISEEEAA